MILAAQIPVDAMQLFGFLGSLGALLWLWNQGKQALGVNPPNHERFVAKPDYVRDQSLLDERLNAATKSRKDMHGDIELHGQRLAALEEGKRHTEITLANIDSKVTTLLQRTPARR